MRYASDPDGNPNNQTCDYYSDTNSLAESMTVTAAHEYAETATDPTGPGCTLGICVAWCSAPGTCPMFWGWSTNDPGDNPIEIGDQCQGYNGTYSASDLDSAVQSNAPYLWSQNANACVPWSGRDYSSPDSTPPFHGVHTVPAGPILTEYQAMGADTGTLGQPLTEQMPLDGGQVSYFANQLCSGGHAIPLNEGYGSSGQTSGSAIFQAPGANRAHEVQGCIYHDYWQNEGGPAGALGWPTSDECSVDSAQDRRSLFQHGTIIWIRATGHLVVQVTPNPPTVCGPNPHNDFNGDGLSDTLGVYNLGNSIAFYEWQSTGTGFTSLGPVWTSGTFCWSCSQFVAGDFNGDGLADIMGAYNLGNGATALYEWQSTVNGFTSLGQVWSSTSFTWGQRPVDDWRLQWGWPDRRHGLLQSGQYGWRLLVAEQR